MMCTTNRRGAALVLVIGLLTIVAMLGSSFVVIAHLDARQSRHLADKSQADPIARGVVEQLCAILSADLKIDDAKGPYGAAPMEWAQYIDYPSEAVDRQLASTFYTWDGAKWVWARASRISDDAASYFTNVWTDDTSNNYADTDRDNLKDAYLVDSGVTNSRGEKYYFAVRLADLAGMLCVNTAGNKTPEVNPSRPVNVDLNGYLGAGTYNSLHASRCSGQSQALEDFSTKSAQCLMSPTGAYKPFAIGEELFLRYYATNAPTNSGRLYALLGGLTVENRRLLTTFSCARALVRAPTGAGEQRAEPRKMVDSDPLVSAPARMSNYGQILKLLQLFITGGAGGMTTSSTFQGRFDFGTASSPLMAGYTRITTTPVYTPALGYGWASSGEAGRNMWDYAGSGGSTALTRDCVYDSRPGVFVVDVPWSTTYTVTVYFDCNYQHDKVRIYLEGAFMEEINQPANVVVTRTYTVAVSDGQLTLALQDGGGSDANWLISGLDVNGNQPAPPATGDAATIAAMWTANLWAYQSPASDTEAFAFQPGGAGTLKAYGMTPKLLLNITEAYAKHKANTDVGGNNSEWGYAIELRNFSGGVVDVTKYKLNGTQLSMGPTNLPDGGRVILYQFGQGAQSTTTAQQFFGSPANWAEWKPCNAVDFSGAGTIKLTLTRTIGAEDVPADQVSNDDLSYSCENKANPTGDVEQDIRRDDNPDDCRYLVAAYKTFANAGHRIGLSNNVAATDVQSKAAYPVVLSLKNAPVSNVGELANVYACGPVKDADGNLVPSPVRVGASDFVGGFPDSPRRGRLEFCPATVNGSGYGTDNAYPNVPPATMIGEMFQVAPPDATRLDGETRRLYGLLNVNTAPEGLLQRLPFPATITVGSNVFTVNAATAASYIVSYREKRQTSDGQRNYANRASATGILNLRTGTGDINGFLTPGEVAIPLVDYAKVLMGGVAGIDKQKDYAEARDAIFRAVSNLLTVHSDVYAANILVQVGKPAKAQWRYVAVIDRSDCRVLSARPAVLLFSEVR